MPIQSRPPDVENLNTDASPVGKDLEEEIKKSTSFATADQQLSEQATIVELRTKIERLQSDLQSKSDENSTLHIKVKDLMSQLEAHTSHNDQQDKSFDVQFQYPYDPLQRHMASSFKKHIRYVPFTAKVDPVTKRIFNVQIHEDNRDSEQII
jgi:regulator of replication initiation timing